MSFQLYTSSEKLSPGDEMYDVDPPGPFDVGTDLLYKPHKQSQSCKVQSHGSSDLHKDLQGKRKVAWRESRCGFKGIRASRGERGALPAPFRPKRRGQSTVRESLCRRAATR